MSSPPLVLKFGGTSLGTAARVRRAALRVRFHLRSGRAPIVVVSAMGSTTDRILRRVSGVIGPASAAPRELDRALATGEDLAAALLAAALAALGIGARSLRGGEAGIRAVGGFGAGAIESVDPGVLRGLTAAGLVPVVSGFQGRDRHGETVTLGRGGSDITAVAIAASVDAPCHIVTDVNAVYSADPRLDPEARPLDTLEPAELVALTERGARVIHPAAARLAASAGVPLHVYHFGARPGAERGSRIEPENCELPIAI